MTTPGSGPKEQMTLMRYFMAHHARIDTMVLNVDERWCGHDPSLPVIFAFPFWLYGSDLDYLAHLLSTRAITAARSRIELALGLRSAADPRGYTDYETGRTRNFHPGPIVERFPETHTAEELPIPISPLSTHWTRCGGAAFVNGRCHRGAAGLSRKAADTNQIAADLPECKAALTRRARGPPA